MTFALFLFPFTMYNENITSHIMVSKFLSVTEEKEVYTYKMLNL